MNFLRLFQLVGRHKWLLLTIVIVATATTWFGTRMKGATYQATATLLPQQRALEALKGTSNVAKQLGDPDQQDDNSTATSVSRARMESLIALMMSPRVLSQVSSSLQLPLTPTDLEKLIKVEGITSDVLRIRATARTPELAQELANGLASSFVQYYGDLSTGTINESIRLMTQEEQRAGKELDHAKNTVGKYKTAHGITSLTDQLNGVIGQLNTTRQARDGTSAQLAELGAQLRELESQIARTPQTIRVVDRTNDSPTAQELRNQIGQLEKDLALERGTHTETHPRVIELKAKLDSANRRLREEEGRMIAHVRLTANPEYATLVQHQHDFRAQREGLVSKAASYNKSLTALQRDLNRYTGADVQLANLMQRYNSAETRFTSVQTRLQQARANADVIRSSSAITIVDQSGPQNPPVDISLGMAIKVTVAAFILSLALTIFILAAWDYLDRRVRTTVDAEELVELPIAGIIPRALPRPVAGELPPLAALVPSGPESEAYRFLALQLLLSRSEEPTQVLMVATAKPGQGASTTLSNLAATLAQGNRRVILVDCDLRRPSLHAMFGAANEVGLTTVLAEGLPVERALQSTSVPNLALLPAGPACDNPWALLRSTSMEGLVRRLRQMADFILIDTPSAAAFADAFNVAPLVDGAFMIVRSRHQPTGIEMKIKQMFEEAGVKVLGTILNGVPMNDVESCRYHHEYYSRDGRGKSSPPALPAARI
jgi:capsular exopolysaccharide synthesis family protein